MGLISKRADYVVISEQSIFPTHKILQDCCRFNFFLGSIICEFAFMYITSSCEHQENVRVVSVNIVCCSLQLENNQLNGVHGRYHNTCSCFATDQRKLNVKMIIIVKKYIIQITFLTYHMGLIYQ